MCHFLLRFRGLSNFFDYHFGEALAMTVFAAIAFATLLLEYDNLIALHEGNGYFAYNLYSFNGRSTDLYVTVGVYEENAVKLYGLTLFLVVAEIVYIQELTGLSLELLSLDFYNCVHLTY